jgi:hypothetical protein
MKHFSETIMQVLHELNAPLGTFYYLIGIIAFLYSFFKKD